MQIPILHRVEISGLLSKSGALDMALVCNKHSPNGYKFRRVIYI